MKTLSFFLSILLLTGGIAQAQPTWGSRWPSFPGSGTVRSLACPDSVTVLAVLENGAIFRSADRGNTWSAAAFTGLGHSPSVAVAFADARNGVIAGAKGSVARSTDGGQLWGECRIDVTAQLHAVAMPAPSIVICAGDTGFIAVTRDGGRHWTQGVSPVRVPIVGISFPDTTVGFCAGPGGTILRSTDLGATWTTLQSNTTRDLRSIHFTDRLHGYACADWVVMKTVDGGDTWTPELGQGQFVYFLDPLTGFTGTANKIFRSADASRSWTCVSTEAREIVSVHTTFVKAIAFGSRLFGVAGGTDGMFLLTRDGGNTWSMCSGPNDGFRPTSMQFLSPERGWIGSEEGRVWRTDDSGVSWHRSSIPTSGPIIGISFFSSDSGWALDADGLAMETRDGGGTWRGTRIAVPAQMKFYGLAFRDPLHGLAVGSSGAVFGTSSGGAQWVEQWSGTRKDLRSVAWTDSTHAVAIGIGGVITRTTDAGSRWNIVSSGIYPDLRALCVTDASTVIAAGNDVCLRSSDAGATWETLLPAGTVRPSSVLTSAFADTDWGILGRESDDGIVETFDGATSWRTTLLTVTPPGTLRPTARSSSFSDPVHGFVGLHDGRVMRGSWKQPSAAQLSSSSAAIGFAAARGASSSTRRLWLSNKGYSSLPAPTITIIGPDAPEFTAVSNDGGAAWSSGSRHGVDVTWTAGAPGTKNAILRIDAPGAVPAFLEVGLHAETTQPRWTQKQNVLRFGDVTVGREALLTVSITSRSDVLVPAPRPALTGADSGDFQIVGITPATVQPGQDATISIRFRPTHEFRSSEAWLRIDTTTAAATVETVALEAYGVRPMFTASAPSLNFGSVGLTLSKDDTLRIRNSGRGVLEILEQHVTNGDTAAFAIIRAAAAVLPAGDSTIAIVRFSPQTGGNASATFTFALRNAASPVVSISMTGTGMGPLLQTNRTSFDFGTVLSDALAVDSIRITNTGSIPLHLYEQSVDGADSLSFRIVRRAASRIDAGRSSTLLVGCLAARMAQPPPADSMTAGDNDAPVRARSPLHATLLLRSDDTWNTLRPYPLTAEVIDTAVRVTPQRLDFDSTLDIATRVLTVEFENRSSMPTRLESVRIEGADAAQFVLDDAPGTSIAGRTRGSARVRFLPGGEGERKALLHLVFSDARVYDALVPLSGRAVRSPLQITPQRIVFDTLHVSTSASSFLIRNISATRQRISGIQWSEGNYGRFTVAHPSVTEFEPGDSTRVTVNFHPIYDGTYSSTFRILFAASILYGELWLSGTGLRIPSDAAQPAEAFAFLGPPWPQPAGDIVTVPFSLAAAAHAVLSVHDALGRRVAVLSDDSFAAGGHTRSFDTSLLPAGLYMLVLEAGSGGRHTRRFIIGR